MTSKTKATDQRTTIAKTAVERAHEGEGWTPASAERQAEVRKRAAKPKAKAATKAKKHSDADRAVAQRAEELHRARGGKWSVGPVQAKRARAALGDRQAVDVLATSLARGRKVASGEEKVPKSDRPESFAAFSDSMTDPFVRGRGAAAFLVALAEEEAAGDSPGPRRKA
jgi:hypothetical protein